MGLLFKKLWRDVKEAKGQFVSILVVIVIGVLFYTSLNSTLRNLRFASERYFTAYRLADLWISFQKAPENVVRRIRSLPGVKLASGRVGKDQQIEIAGHDAIIRIITLPDRRSEVVNDVMLKAGRYFSEGESNQCLVSEAFFRAQRLRFGSYLEPIINGNRVKLKVIGVVKSPEYVYELRDGSEMIPDPDRFGIVYLKQSYGQAVLDFNGSLNEVSVLLKDGVDPEPVRRKLEKTLERYGLIETTLKKDQLSYNTFSGEIEQLTALSGVFPMIFLLVAAAIIYITMTRIIENQRLQIGTMKALGYGNGAIMVHYLSYAVLVGLAGSILGSGAGIYLGGLLMQVYNEVYQLPLEQMTIHYDLILPASLLTLCFCLLAGYNSCKNELKLPPAESMRPKAPKSGTKTWIERIGPLWRNFSFSWKIILRNLFRYKRRALLTSIGIICATALLLTAVGLNDSIGFLVDQQYSTIQRYDLKATFDTMLAPAELSYIRSLPHVTRMEPVTEIGVEIRHGWRTKKAGLTGLIRDSRLYRVVDRSGAPVAIPAGGVLIPEKLGQILGAGLGDVVQLRPLWPGRNEERYQKAVWIKGVVSQYVGQSVYSLPDFCGRLLEEDQIANGVMLQLDHPGEQAKVIAKLKEMPTVAAIQSRSDAVANLQEALQQSAFSIGFMILASGALAFAVIYNITTINIFERRRELATLKVLGFTNPEMRQLIFNENLIITALAAGAGLLLGRSLLNWIVVESATDNMSFPAILNQSSYLVALVLIFAFTVSANLILMRKVHAVNMVEALKSSE